MDCESRLIKAVVAKQIRGKRGYVTIPSIQKLIGIALQLNVSKCKITKVIKKDLKLKYKKVKNQYPYINSNANIKLRKAYATKLLNQFGEN